MGRLEFTAGADAPTKGDRVTVSFPTLKFELTGIVSSVIDDPAGVCVALELEEPPLALAKYIVRELFPNDSRHTPVASQATVGAPTLT